MKPIAVTIFLFAAWSVGCADPADKAAKKRIFSPEDPPQAVAAASTPLPPQSAADDGRIARRILGMGAAEATERLGPHRYSATVDWEWSSGGKTIRMKETRELTAGPGGVSGDFAARLSNTNNAGLEVLRAGGKVFARNTWGKEGEAKFRQRLRDRGMGERLREESFGALRDLDQLFLGRLKLTAQSSSQNTASFLDRTAWKYTVSLGDRVADQSTPLPPVAAPKGGFDDTTRRRLHFYDRRAPLSLQGELLVDALTSVVLKAHIVGRMAVKGEASAGGVNLGDAELRITLDCALADVGKPVAIKPPADFLPDEDKPDGIAAALVRFGIARKGADAGVAEPEDDDEAK